MSMVSEALIATEKPGDYIIRLCKHFGHKIPAVHDETSGQVEFEAGTCRLEARPGLLAIRVEGADDAALDRLEGVVTRHLERFAWREAPEITWRRGDRAAGASGSPI